MSLNDSRCPKCFSQLGTWKKDPILTKNGAKFVYDDSSGLLVPEADISKRYYKGFLQIKAEVIQELQDNRKQTELEVGIEVVNQTQFSKVKSDEYGYWIVNKKHIRELRESTEKILEATGQTKEEYFNYDEEQTERQFPHQFDWIDPILDNWKGRIKDQHIEDLRKFLRTGQFTLNFSGTYYPDHRIVSPIEFLSNSTDKPYQHKVFGIIVGINQTTPYNAVDLWKHDAKISWVSPYIGIGLIASLTGTTYVGTSLDEYEETKVYFENYPNSPTILEIPHSKINTSTKFRFKTATVFNAGASDSINLPYYEFRARYCIELKCKSVEGGYSTIIRYASSLGYLGSPFLSILPLQGAYNAERELYTDLIAIDATAINYYNGTISTKGFYPDTLCLKVYVRTQIYNTSLTGGKTCQVSFDNFQIANI